MSTPTVLPAAVVSRLAPAAAPRFLRAAVVRGLAYLVPVPLAVAAGDVLGRVPWQVPVAAVAVGWCALTALVGPGLRPGGRAGGPGPAGRRVLGVFVLVTAGWSLALLPFSGPDLVTAYAVSLPALVLLAALAVARATGSEAVLLRWSLPALLVAGAAYLDLLSAPEPVLAAAIALLAARVLAPTALGRGTRADHGRTSPSFGERGWIMGTAGLALGLGQAATVVLVWRVGHPVAPGAVPPGLLPLLVAVPVLEIWVGWHLARLAAGLARHDDRQRYLRYARRLGWATLAALLPPLVAGAALAGTVTRLPYGLSAHPDAPALVLTMASGVLLAGVVAVGWLLAARNRPLLAAVVTGGPVLGAFGLSAGVPELVATSLSGWGRLLPATVVALAGCYAAGLVLAALVLFGDAREPNRYHSGDAREPNRYRSSADRFNADRYRCSTDRFNADRAFRSP